MRLSISSSRKSIPEALARRKQPVSVSRRSLLVGLTTRAIVARNVGETILDVIDEADAEQVLLGWQGTRSTREHILGSTIDPIVADAPCDVSLVKLGRVDQEREVGTVVALAGEGPHAPVAARRASEFVETAGDPATVTLINVQPGDAENPEDTGEAVIQDVAATVNLAADSYSARVVVAADPIDRLVSAAAAYDTVCVGATRSTAVSQALFGSLPERIGVESPGTVVMCRGGESSPRTLREALIERLSE